MQNPASVPIDHYSDFLSRLPADLDLDELARVTGAIQRKREVGDGASLLRLVLARGPGGLSLRQTSGWASLSGTAELSNPGVHYRLKQSASFVEAVVERLLLDKLPGSDLRWPDRRLCLADGTCISKPGSKGTDWRVHGVFDLGRGGFSHLGLTDAHGTEALDRGTAMPGEIRIGDRNYARTVVLKRFLADSDGTADFIVRVGWNALQFRTPNGNAFDLIDHLCNLPVDMELHEQLMRMAQESGIDTPTIDDLVRLDRQRKGKKLSNADWASKTDPDAKIARMKNGSTRLAYKPEHAVDLDTGVIVAAPIHPADKGDTTTLDPTLEAAARNLTDLGLAPTSEDPCDLVTDKGYHSREILKGLDSDIWKTRIAEPAPPNGYLRWHGDEAAQKAVYANRSRLKSAVGRKAMRKRGEMVERSFAHVLDRGGMRRAWLRGRENVHKRYLIHVAGFNLGILMRALFGSGTPKGTRGASRAFLFVVQTDVALVIALIAEFDGERTMLLIVFAPEGA